MTNPNQQQFEAMLCGPNPGDGIVHVHPVFTRDKAWEDVWGATEVAATTLGFAGVAAMRAVSPRVSAWLTQDNFDYQAKERARD